MSVPTEEKAAFNALNIATEGNYSFLRNLYDRYGSFAGALAQARDESFGTCARANTVASARNMLAEIDPGEELRRLEKQEVALLMRLDEAFPEALRHIDDPPFALYIKGMLPAGSGVAVVGTRKCSAYGKRACAYIVEGLSRYDEVVVISGLALGIDGVAHRTALATGLPTVAVIGSGIGALYPAAHRSLARDIVANGGSLISEFPLMQRPQRHFFPQRNRIVSALAKAVVVIEAPQRSGSLITARMALEQGRDVFVVPARLFDNGFAGSHALLFDGATPLVSADDIAQAYGWEVIDGPIVAPELSPGQQKIVAILNQESEASFDDLASILETEAEVLGADLSVLELHGIIKEINGVYGMQ